MHLNIGPQDVCYNKNGPDLADYITLVSDRDQNLHRGNYTVSKNRTATINMT